MHSPPGVRFRTLTVHFLDRYPKRMNTVISRYKPNALQVAEFGRSFDTMIRQKPNHYIMQTYFWKLFVAIILTGHLCEAQQPVQNIRGTVKDASTGQQLYGANIVLEGTSRGTITGEDGQFMLTGIPVGRHTLQVLYVGYEPVVIPELLVGSGKEVYLDIEMETRISELEEVYVRPTSRKDRPVNSMALVSARTFSVEEASRYAGAVNDPGRMAGNFAGVATAGVNVNAIVVRGNAPKNLSWRLEGVDIPVPSHFAGSNVAGGGGLTIFSSSMLANSDFYTGAFPAEFGNAAAGVFDMKLRNGNNRKREYAIQAGVQGIETAAEGPLGSRGGGSYLVNYRYSTMALIFPLLPELEHSDEVPFYQDLSFKLNLPGGKAGTFSAWGIGGLSHTSMKGTDDPEKWIFPESRVRMKFHYNMGAGGISHSKSLSEKTIIRSTLALSAGQHYYDKASRLDPETPDELFPLYKIDMTEGKGTFSSTLTHTVHRGLILEAGGKVDRKFYQLTGTARDFESGQVGSILEGTGATWLINGFVQGKYTPLPFLTLAGGLHASWFGISDQLLLEPRLSSSFRIAPRQEITLGYGNHSRIEPLFVYFVSRENPETGLPETPNRNLTRMRAHHFVLGYHLAVSPNLHLRAEPYYQLLYDVPVVQNSPYSMLNFMRDWTFNQPLVNEGTGRNIGLDLTLERFLKDGFYYMVTASVYRSEYTGGDKITRRTRYDGGYVLNILGGREWEIGNGNLLGINLRCNLMGPFWHQPVDEAASRLAQEAVYNQEMPFTFRYANLETVNDLSIHYRINRQGRSSVISLRVNNIIGRQYMGKKFNLKTQELEDDFFSSPIPFVSYKLEF